ncbi:hypothetical protein [Aliarcobacter butzleri]|uniref:hypothetical protein n=1 Tax=Aliarcobacter butzleri TaxID=28197 RepID=UPI003AF379D8
MAPAIGTVVLIGGIVVAGVAYFMYKNKNIEIIKSNQSDGKLLSDEDRYKGDKNIILRATEEKDWETLEDLLKDRSIKDFPDLIKMIEEALKNKQ